MMITIPIDNKTADALVVEHLSDWREYLIKENKSLKKLDSLKPHQEADYKANKKYIKALNIVIEAFTWPEK